MAKFIEHPDGPEPEPEPRSTPPADSSVNVGPSRP